MPVNSCSSNGKPGYKWGDAGKCYSYDPNNKNSMKEAKKKAIAQGIAIGDIELINKNDVDESSEELTNEIFELFSVKEIDLIALKLQNFDLDSKNDFDKSLTQWFREKWVDISRPKRGGGFEPCGRSDANTGKYPKCVPASRAARMTPEEIASAVRRKRRAESTQTRDGKKPIYVSTEKAETRNIPTNPALYARVKAEAKRKFDVYPSAYANAWLVREYKRRGGGYRTSNKSEDITFEKKDEMINGYPAATQDISINIRNRQDCIDIANYGPMNPALENQDFWQKKADIFNTSIDEAKTARCSNCAAFIQTSDMIEAIAEGLGGEEEAYGIIKLANLGFCEIFDFKCAGSRTCDAWVVNGPVTDENIDSEDESNKYNDLISALADYFKNKEI